MKSVLEIQLIFFGFIMSDYVERIYIFFLIVKFLLKTKKSWFANDDPDSLQEC